MREGQLPFAQAQTYASRRPPGLTRDTNDDAVQLFLIGAELIEACVRLVLVGFVGVRNECCHIALLAI
jgi:hypothetical protein